MSREVRFRFPFMTDAKKKILLVSYHFPPSPAVGGIRIFNFARNLPAFGFRTSVLTVDDRYHDKLDASRIEEIRGIEVIKTLKTPKLSRAYTGLKSLVTKGSPGKKSIPSPAPAGSAGAAGEGLAKRLRRYARAFLTLPDGERNWVLPAVLSGLRIIRRDGIECVLTSCPPYSVHLIGLYLKTLTGVKWIADFRDPWMTTGSKRLYQTCALSLGIERWIERQVIRRSDMALFNTSNLRDAYRKRYSAEPERKFVYVPNGYDPTAFSRYRGLEMFPEFTITYTGSLYLGRTPEPVFSAIKALIDEGRIGPQELKLKLIGQCSTIGGRPARTVIDSYGLAPMVEVMDAVPYSVAVETIGRSHLALLLAPEQPYQIPAKVYDYIGAGVRILAIAGEGATADFVETNGAGRAFSSTDVEGIKEFIYASFSERTRKAGGGGIAGLEAERVAETLAGHISNVVFAGNRADRAFSGVSYQKR